MHNGEKLGGAQVHMAKAAKLLPERLLPFVMGDARNIC